MKTAIIAFTVSFIVSTVIYRSNRRKKNGGRIAMVSDAQKRANEKYRRESVRQFAVRFYPADSDAWEHLQKQPNKAGYIKALIRADMEKSAE